MNGGRRVSSLADKKNSAFEEHSRRRFTMIRLFDQDWEEEGSIKRPKSFA